MGTLHLVMSASPGALTDCLRAALPGDAVLLLQDGVYAAASIVPGAGGHEGVALHIHDTDARARALPAETRLAGMTAVDDDGFVALTENHARVVSWF
ncbi:MAG: sulfurtransferase complex subunit TusB [Pseudomonadota bacterium]